MYYVTNGIIVAPFVHFIKHNFKATLPAVVRQFTEKRLCLSPSFEKPIEVQTNNKYYDLLKSSPIVLLNYLLR